MKKKIIIPVLLVVLMVFVAIGVYMNNKRNSSVVEPDLENLKPPKYVGKKEYNGTKVIYLENTTDKEVEKVTIIEYSGDDNQVTATYEINKEELNVDENSILTAQITDKDDVNYKVSIITDDNEEYEMDKLIGANLACNNAVIPFKIDENNKKIILLKEIDDGEYVELKY